MFEQDPVPVEGIEGERTGLVGARLVREVVQGIEGGDVFSQAVDRGLGEA